MIFFEDDFYYYLKVAANLAHGSGSTFNGLVQTNGYHPLWLMVLTGISLFPVAGWGIYWCVVAIAAAATFVVFYSAERLMAEADLNPLLRRALAAYAAIYALHNFYTGMEVILAVPLMFTLAVVLFRSSFWTKGFWQAAALGLLMAATILARLDLILFVALVAFWAVVNRDIRSKLGRNQLTGIAVGLLPVLAYFALNHTLFATWLPVSGMAKQLKLTHTLSLRPWSSVYLHGLPNWLNLLPIHVAVITLPFVWRRLSPMQKVVFPSALLFPFLYVLSLSFVSDWQLWLWYLYPMRLALCVSFVVFSFVPGLKRLLRASVATALVVLILIAETATAKWWTDVQPAIYAAALDVQRFSLTHPGTYAMGDRSGMVAYLISQPLVQTEGLVMDRRFLEHIRKQDPLQPVLASYGVKYYVGTAWHPYKGCFHAVEPFQAGRTSAHMVGDICQAPVATSQHEEFQTVIFDLNGH